MDSYCMIRGDSYICLSNLFERLGRPLGEVVAVSVHK